MPASHTAGVLPASHTAVLPVMATQNEEQAASMPSSSKPTSNAAGVDLGAGGTSGGSMLAGNHSLGVGRESPEPMTLFDGPDLMGRLSELGQMSVGMADADALLEMEALLA